MKNVLIMHVSERDRGHIYAFCKNWLTLNIRAEILTKILQIVPHFEEKPPIF